MGALGLGAPPRMPPGHRPGLPPNGAALRGAKAAPLGATRAGKAFWRVIQVKCAFGTRAGARVGPYFGAFGGSTQHLSYNIQNTTIAINSA